MAIEVGSKISGKVSGITNFGAFVDLGDHKTGLVHISEISDSYIKDIKDVLTVGDEVKVKVLKIGDDGKIALSIRKAKPESERKPEHHSHNHNNHGNSKRDFGNNHRHNDNHKKASFDDLMNNFLKDSESRLATIKKNTEGKRGGRGGRRS
ncbi:MULTISPECIES: S1 domain-containing RNA-binding protein [Apilactobacillus]|uniref:RNA-binding protein S1 n=2 Tax=Apilactobacillus TaxID=2767877 RepID=A0A2S2JLM1_9LACO|nr:MULTISPECIES: S1 domain-containing RNA-binding protein [Apilactobacillus]TPR12198.1 RNA-binding protein S1 [Apilactobacillus timberlakei]TPR12478.1 RNA-binding protein S1 [Apilactobacillus timberlakei]TPR13598.1 RNA-binding protein S1 [Apilactobacillus timberlakei]TPR23470.1 RNA-binding protein S1 [Apilactobacillus micheneri]TPR24812.1 RNA-binding protein S1 [Apilactobacillus micheneri]